MDAKLDLNRWKKVKEKIKSLYPQLSDADLICRHQSKENLYYLISTKLVISKKEFTEILDSL